MFSRRGGAITRWLKVPAALILWSVFISPSCPEPMLPHLFSDHMVLQRDSEVHLWGWADPGEKISGKNGFVHPGPTMPQDLAGPAEIGLAVRSLLGEPRYSQMESALQ
jgi:hypothetical protein